MPFFTRLMRDINQEIFLHVYGMGKPAKYYKGCLKSREPVIMKEI